MEGFCYVATFLAMAQTEPTGACSTGFIHVCLLSTLLHIKEALMPSDAEGSLPSRLCPDRSLICLGPSLMSSSEGTIMAGRDDLRARGPVSFLPKAMESSVILRDIIVAGY